MKYSTGNESEEKNHTQTYFSNHEWIAIGLFVIVFMLGTVSARLLEGSLQLILKRQRINLSEWLLAGVFLLCILSMLTKYLKLATIAPFGY